MGLQTEFKKVIERLPREPITNENFDQYIDIQSDFKDRFGLDVEWYEFNSGGKKVGAWKVDMGVGVNDFLKLNPDIQSNLIKRFKGNSIVTDQLKNFKVSRKSVLGFNSKVSVADLVLDELIENTKAGDPTAWVGQRIKRYGNASSDFKNKVYRSAAMEGRLTAGANNFKLIDEGGVIHMPTATTTFPGTRDEYRAAAQNWRESHPKLTGFQKKHGVLYEGGEQMRVRNAGTSTHPRIVVQTKKAVEATNKAQLESGRIQAPSGEELVDVTKLDTPEGFEWHHRRMRGAFKPFFTNLGKEEGQELADYTANKWKSLGDVDGNLELLEDSLHGEHHAFLKDSRLQVDNRSFPDFSKADMNARKQGIDLWFEYMQPAADDNLASLKRAARKAAGSARKIGTAESALRLASGDYIGGTIGLAMQSPVFHKKIGKALAKTFAKSGAKLLPGVGMSLSTLEAAGYASQGKWTQSGISALSGLVGEVPLVGDAVSAGLDLTNTAIDIATGNVKPELDIEDDSNIRRAARAGRTLFN